MKYDVDLSLLMEEAAIRKELRQIQLQQDIAIWNEEGDDLSVRQILLQERLLDMRELFA